MSRAARAMLITAGPTHEPLDTVRYLANRSSGRLGLALATAARDAGWKVTLLLGPTTLPPPAGVRTLRFESTADLAALLDRHFARCDVLVMAAAVADYRPARVRTTKLPRRGGGLVLRLEPTPDLVAACAARKRAGQRVIGFALEARERLAQRALDKRRRKGLDAIVANPLETLGSPRIRAVVYTARGTAEHPPGGRQRGLTKTVFAAWLVRWIEAAVGGIKAKP